MSVLVTGGARSGKSSFAEKWCMAHADQAIYVATAQAFDTEMADRIGLHRLQRAQAKYEWETVEEPLKLAELLDTWKDGRGESGDVPAVLVDCLTLWLSNMLLALEGEEDMEERLQAEIDRLVNSIEGYPGLLVLVTNEVGDGIVPEYRLGRLFRDYAGFLNQRIARISSQVFLVTVGIPIELKSREFML